MTLASKKRPTARLHDTAFYPNRIGDADSCQNSSCKTESAPLLPTNYVVLHRPVNPSKLEKSGANEFVAKSIASDHPELLECLMKLAAVSAEHKTSRNEVAHSNAFSTRELGLFSAVVSLNLDVGDKTQINELMNSYFLESGAELALLVAEMVTGIEKLLDALAPIYDISFQEMPNECPAST